jgi:hypothetical protein
MGPVSASSSPEPGHEPGSAAATEPRGPTGTPWDAELVAALAQTELTAVMEGWTAPWNVPKRYAHLAGRKSPGAH